MDRTNVEDDVDDTRYFESACNSEDEATQVIDTAADAFKGMLDEMGIDPLDRPEWLKKFLGRLATSFPELAETEAEEESISSYA